MSGGLHRDAPPKPSGVNGAGTLVIVPPIGIAPNALATGTVDGKQGVALNTDIKLAAGRHTLSFGSALVDEQVDIVAGQTLTYQLAAIRVKLPTTPTLGLNAHATGSPRVADGITLSLPNDSVWSAAPFAPLPVQDGMILTVAHAPQSSVQLSWGLGDGVVVSAAPGAVVDVDLGDTSERTVVTMHAPARSLPTADWAHLGGDATPYWLMKIWNDANNASVTARVPVPDNATIAFGLKGAFGSDDEVDFSYEILPGAGAVSPASFLRDANQNMLRSADVKMGRIDVTDVALTNTDGTHKVVKGTYSLSTPDVSETATGPTGTGFDAVPGSYTLTTSYTTDAGPMSSSSSVDVTAM